MNDEIGKALLDHLMRRSSLLVLVFDAEGGVVDANTGAATILGFEPKGMSLEKVFLDFRSELSLESLLAVPEKRLLSVHGAAGVPHTLLFTFRKVGDQILALGDVDLDELVRTRESFFKANAELNNLTRELQKSNAELVRLSDLKNEFLGIAVHDLRNPIANIFSVFELLLDEESTLKLPTEDLHLIQNAQSMCEHMLGLLDDLLDITAFEVGKLSVELKLTEISEIVDIAVLMNGFAAKRKRILVHRIVGEGIPRIELDKSKMLQALNNLLSNAIKYSSAGSQVLLKAEVLGSKVVISVIDHGQGIPKDEIKKLFKPFSKTSVKPTAGEKSTGLGLVIAQKIVNAHRGNIRVESEVGTGSSFHIELPVADAQPIK